MKKIFFIFIFFLFFPGYVSAFIPIVLDKNDWWIKSGFEWDWMQEDKFDDDSLWNKVGSVPVVIPKNLSEEKKNIIEASLVTNFDYKVDENKYEGNLGIIFPAIGQSWQIYLNGKLIKDEMFLDDEYNVKTFRSVRDSLISFHSSLLKEGSNILFIRIKGDPRFWKTGLSFNSGYMIDIYSKLENKKSENLIFIFLGIYLFIAFYHILLFFKRSKEKYNLYFGLYGIFVFIYFFLGTNSIFNLYSDTSILWRFELIVLFSLFPFMMAFVETLFFNKISVFVKVYSIFCAVIAISIPFLSLYLTEYILRIWQISALGVLVYFGYLFYKAIKIKVKEVYPLIAGVLVLTGTIAFDIVDTLFIHTGFAFSKYGLLIYVIGISVILANKFNYIYRESEDLNVNLENRVKERTVELEKILGQVNELKMKQDGDYYLTSLLLKSLVKNDVNSNNLIIKELTSQHKKVKFKNFEFDIGGDLNVSTTIKLNGRRYIAFLNSDAMGKSMQGAGGALIAGVIFNLFLERSKTTKEYKLKSPEIWLKECFYDLHHVFLSFNESMLVTMVMGLIDESNGFVYYINAEHPHSVLYRKGFASFLDTEVYIHKLGMNLNKKNISIGTFNMLPDDILIFGSDGKYEIQTGIDDSGNRIINDNESLFLTNVEVGNGDIYDILKSIKEKGDLIDDISMMTIKYNPEKINNLNLLISREEPVDELKNIIAESESLNENGSFKKAISFLETSIKNLGNNPILLEKILELNIKNKKYLQAAELGIKYTSYAPHDIELLYLASYSIKLANVDENNYFTRIKGLELAADFGERCMLRDLSLVKNIFNLADIYRLLDDKEKALELLNAGLAIDDSDKSAMQLKKILTA